MGEKGVSGCVTFSVISANASAALLCRSTFSEYERVDNALNGSPVKKFVSARSSSYEQSNDG
jgi:hypothetical protein